MIRVENLQKRIGSKTILDIHLQLEKGKIHGLIGPNGAGKTTLLSILSSTTPFDAGEVYIGELSLRKHLKKIRKLIGYVPQEVALYPSLTVIDNLIFWGKMANIKDLKRRIEEIVRLLKLDSYLYTKVNRLSGGYSRRVNIAVALLHEPEILIMDEPTVGMDLYSKQDLLPFLKNLTTFGKTIIYTSHDVDEILYLSDRVIMLEQGIVTFEGSVEAAKKQLSILQTNSGVY